MADYRGGAHRSGSICGDDLIIHGRVVTLLGWLDCFPAFFGAEFGLNG